MVDIVSRPLSVHKEHEVLLKLETAGLDDGLAQKLVDSKDNYLATQVVRLLRNGGFEPSTSQKRAREIMGKRFFGVEEAIRHFGVNPSRQQLAALAEVPYSEDVLIASKETHVLVARFPLSILDIRGKVERPLFRNHEAAWYNNEAFAKDRGEVSWHLVREIPVLESIGKTWNEQQALLGGQDETPSAQVLVYVIIGHYLTTGERLFEKVYVRTSSVDSDGDRVLVGYFDAEGLLVNLCWDAYRYSNLGVASARQLSPEASA